MIPFTPHIAHECLELLNCSSLNKWPKIEKNTYENIKLAVQINGKTRDVLTVKKGATEKEINEIIHSSSKANKHLVNTTILKTIFVKNKIINYIVKSK